MKYLYLMKLKYRLRNILKKIIYGRALSNFKKEIIIIIQDSLLLICQLNILILLIHKISVYIFLFMHKKNYVNLKI